MSKLEGGGITWPGWRYRAALRSVFGAADDAELGFAFRSSAWPTGYGVGDQIDGGGSSDVDRQAFLRAALRISAGAAMSDRLGGLLNRASDTEDAPTRVGRADLEQVEHCWRVQRPVRCGGPCIAPWVPRGHCRIGQFRRGLPDREQGLAAGLATVAQQVGAALRVAIFVAVTAAGNDSARQAGSDPAQAQVTGTHHAVIAGAILLTTAALLTLAAMPRQAAPSH